MPPIRPQRGLSTSLLACFLAVVLSMMSSCGGTDKFELTLRDRAAGWPSSEEACILGILGNIAGLGTVSVESLPSDVIRCELTFEERSWVAADGRRAINPAHTGVTSFAVPKLSAVVCGGRQRTRRWWFESGPALPDGVDSFELKIDDGNTLMMEQETGLWVFVVAAGGSVDGSDCVEGSGRWRGTAGELLDRTGTFTILHNSIQTVLRLVED